MANFKRGRPKAARAGCRMCKPNKLGKGMESKLGHAGFGKLRGEAHQIADLSRLRLDPFLEVMPQDVEETLADTAYCYE